MNTNEFIKCISWLLSSLLSCGVYSASLHAGTYVTDEDIVYFYDYLAEGGDLQADVCITPGTQNASTMMKPLQNAIRQWNRSQPTTSNVRLDMLPANKVDLESVLVHELGHCMGLDHPNIGSVVLGDSVNSTSALPGPNLTRDLDAGDDGIFGTADDVRGDDINTFYFRLNNNPFSIAPVVDLSTYSRDIARLPAGDLFPANPEQNVAQTARYITPDSEATMQHNINVKSTVRSLSHDDVATMKLAATGVDGSEGTSDDYTWRLNFLGVSDSDLCDITVAMDTTETAVGSCLVSTYQTSARPGHYLRSGEIHLNTDTDWFFNQNAPCSQRTPLPQNEWRMVSLPCDVGISSSATVADVIGDDLSTSDLGTTWAMFAYDYTTVNGTTKGAYKQLAADDELRNGVGYWIKTLLADRSIDVHGEYPSQLDTTLSVSSDTGWGWNMVGSPFRFETKWADTHIIDTSGKQLSLEMADPAEPGSSGGLGETACTNSKSLRDCKVARYAYKYIGSGYEELSTATGSLAAFEAAWVFSAAGGVSVRLRMPDVELTTP